MPSEVFRKLFCMVIAGFLVAGIGLARAAVYDFGFDPEFNGLLRIQVGNACLLNEDGSYASTGSCTVDLVSADLFDTLFPSFHYTSGFQGNIASQVLIAGNQLTAVEIPDPFLSCGEECSGFLFSTFTEVSLNTDPFSPSNGMQLTDGYVLRRVPEPGSLVLLFGGIGAAWLARRRKTAA